MTTVPTRSVRRREDVRLLTGGGNYAADGKAAGTLVAVLVRSPHYEGGWQAQSIDSIPSALRRRWQVGPHGGLPDERDLLAG